jgi:hypothetical protein
MIHGWKNIKHLGKLGDVTFVVIPESLLQPKNTQTAISVCEIRAWGTINNTDDAWIFNISSMTKSSNELIPMIAFKSHIDAMRIKEWFEQFGAELQDRSWKGYLWPTSTEYEEWTSQGNQGHVVKFPIEKYDGTHSIIISSVCYDVFLWLKQNISGKIWRLSDTSSFVFESYQDAVKFKLTWC